VKIVLVRHAQCLGNVDELAYCKTPDHALPLTSQGEREARAAGPAVRALLDPDPFAVYVSPYLRTRKTLELMGLADRAERIVPEPRLREQDWGNLQDPVAQRSIKRERDAFGHFFFRLPAGESGADVDDRVAAFVSDLALSVAHGHHPKTILVVSHGLSIRLLCRRILSWSVDLFESLTNPGTCEHRVLHRIENRWSLDRPFAQWRDSPDGSTQI